MATLKFVVEVDAGIKETLSVKAELMDILEDVGYTVQDTDDMLVVHVTPDE